MSLKLLGLVSKLFIGVPAIPSIPFLFGKGKKLRWGTPPVPPSERVAPLSTSRMSQDLVQKGKGFCTRLLVIAVLLTPMLLAGCLPDEEPDGKPAVVTSFYPMQYLAERIVGDKMAVENLVPAGIEPHDWEPSPQDITAIQNARVFIYLGILDAWADSAAADLDTNRTIPLRAIDGQKLIGSQDEEITGEDPHVWLSPKRYIQLADVIYSALATADSKNAAFYKSNLDTLKRDLDALDIEFVTGLANCERTTIFTSHAAFGYLAESYGLKQVAVSGISPDVEPSPARLREVLEQIKADKATHIFFETLISPRVEETLAAEAGIRTMVLNPLEGLTDEEISAGDNYIKVMKSNLTNLKVALGCR